MTRKDISDLSKIYWLRTLKCPFHPQSSYNPHRMDQINQAFTNYRMSGTNAHIYFGCRGKTPRNRVRILYESTRDWNGISEMSFELTKNTNCAYAMHTMILTKRLTLMCVCFWSWLNAGSSNHFAFTKTIATKRVDRNKSMWCSLIVHIIL